MKPLKILFLSHKFFPDIGGIEANSEVLAYAFASVGHEVKMMTWSEDNTGRKFPFSIIRNPALLTITKAHWWADVVFENNPCLKLSWPAFVFKKPTVVALNTWISRENGQIGTQDRIKYKWLSRAKKVISVSEAVRDKCWKESVVIGNPYNNDLFRLLPDIKKSKTFVFLGRLVSDKGVDQAIKAIHSLSISDKDNRANYNLTIIGNGPERESLESLVVDLGLREQITFTGALQGEKLVTCLNEHKYILVPSMWEEPFGNVALEGMACGCLPVVSDGGGLPTAVGKAGITFRRGDVDNLVECIKKLIRDPDYEECLRKEFSNHLNKHHPSKVAKQYLQVIENAFRKQINL